jgi:hypothetical protein
MRGGDDENNETRRRQEMSLKSKGSVSDPVYPPELHSTCRNDEGISLGESAQEVEILAGRGLRRDANCHNGVTLGINGGMRLGIGYDF